MPDSESFDAFYARTVWNITSQMHQLADDDALADHAIREAYAKAYQQWYQVSGYSDSEGWVLATAKDAYERRRAEAGAEFREAPAQAVDSGTWPGIYRPRPGAGSPAAADADQVRFDPDATLARPPAGAPAGAYPTTDGMAGSPGPQAPARRAQRPAGTGPGHPGSRRTWVIAGSAIAALLVAGIAYLASSHHTNAPTAGGANSASAGTNQAPQMLPAGQTGQRSAVPWSLVGAGWALAEFSTAQPDSAGQSAGPGSYTTYLVDPEGGKYEITTSSGSTEPQLMAWSGNTKTALFETSSVAGGTGSYQLLNVQTGQLTTLQLPTGVVAVGFTRPDGLAVLAVHQGPAEFRLQRYALKTGQLEASLASLPRKGGEAWPASGCVSACALSSPDGFADVWGIVGDEMQIVGNGGGKPHKLHVKGSGHPSCVPLTWWDDSTVLANCVAAGTTQLWLMSIDGGPPTPLTNAAGSASGNGDIQGGWRANGAVYITQASFNQCPNATSGPGGLNIVRLGQGGSTAAITIPGSTHNVSTVVAADGGRLLVLSQTKCPGTSSLLWFNPSTGTSQVAVTAPGNEVGVIAAVPFGNGPTAVTSGQFSGG